MGRPKADRTLTRIQVLVDQDELAQLERIAKPLGGISAAARME